MATSLPRKRRRSHDAPNRTLLFNASLLVLLKWWRKRAGRLSFVSTYRFRIDNANSCVPYLPCLDSPTTAGDLFTGGTMQMLACIPCSQRRSQRKHERMQYMPIGEKGTNGRPPHNNHHDPHLSG